MTTRNPFVDPIEAPDLDVKIVAKDGDDNAGYMTVGDLSDTIFAQDITVEGTLAVDEIQSANHLLVGPDGSTQFEVEATAAAVNHFTVTPGATGVDPILGSPRGAVYNAAASQVHTFKVNNLNAFTVAGIATSERYVAITAGNASTHPTIAAAGTLADIGLLLQAKGTQQVLIHNGSGRGLAVSAAASSVNYVLIQGVGTGGAPLIDAAGTGTDIDLHFRPKGTGVMRFGTHTTNADTAISGYITIKDAGGTVRKLAVIT